MTAPKKIWVIRDRYVVEPEKVCEKAAPYIRADLVDDLVEALKAVVRYHQAANSTEPVDLLAYYSDAYDKVKASLARIKDE